MRSPHSKWRPIISYGRIKGLTVLVGMAGARFDRGMDPRLFAEWAQIDEHLRRAIIARESRFHLSAVLIRQLIQRRLWDGRLSHEPSVELSCGPGTRRTCNGCGTPILPHDTMTVRIGVEDSREIRLHQQCLEIWDEERLKAPQPQASHS